MVAATPRREVSEDEFKDIAVQLEGDLERDVNARAHMEQPYLRQMPFGSAARAAAGEDAPAWMSQTATASVSVMITG